MNFRLRGRESVETKNSFSKWRKLQVKFHSVHFNTEEYASGRKFHSDGGAGAHIIGESEKEMVTIELQLPIPLMTVLKRFC